MEQLAFQFVEIKRYEELVLLTLNDPPANTLTYDLVLQLEDAFFELTLDTSIRAVVITGAGGRFFSGGVNIGMLRNVSPHYNSNFLLYAAEVFSLIDRSPLLVVAAINGHVTGGGLELALVADRRVAVEGNYNFGFPEIRLGVIPGLGGTQRLSRLVGARRALALMMRGEFLSATRASELGIVDAVFPKEDFVAAAIRYARAELGRPATASPVATPMARWRRPDNLLVSYQRRDRIGLIALNEDCRSATPLQVLWALNRAILAARMDDEVEAILVSHHGAELRLGADEPIDPRVKDYAEFVFGRLENFPRLCVLAFRGALDRMATELALACDHRLTPTRALSAETILTIPGGSSRCARYFPRTDSPLSDRHVTFAQALESGLIETADASSWPEPMLAWMARFVSPRGASKAIGYAKLAVVKGSALPHEAGMLLERHLQEQLFRGHDGPEGMRAYLEKRSAVFKGE